MTSVKNAEAAEKTEKIRIGTGLIRHLSTSFYPNPRIIFDELVSNSRDAMATEVRIHVEENSITIEDNGEGMSPDELVRFFYISHTTKGDEPIRTKGDMEREIIGRFGIGKLSMYQLCEWFEIESWKSGTLSKARFDFKGFEKNEFIDDFFLKVTSEKTPRTESGTRVTLYGIKQKISAMQIKRSLMMTMPLTKDFRILISGIGLSSMVEVKSEDVTEGKIHEEYNIDEVVPEVGRVIGKIAYKKSERGEFGVFIRVFGRLVNLDNPHGIINFSSLDHARQFARRIYAELNVNSLNEALLTNRSGFMIEDKRYKAFTGWLKTRLNKFNEEQYQSWKKRETESEKTVVSEAVSELLREVLQDSGYNIDIKVSIKNLGSKNPGGIFSKKDGMVVINSSHPLYLAAKHEGRSWGVLYHSLMTAIVFLAIGISETKEDFTKLYHEMTGHIEKIKGVRVPHS